MSLAVERYPQTFAERLPRYHSSSLVDPLSIAAVNTHRPVTMLRAALDKLFVRRGLAEAGGEIPVPHAKRSAGRSFACSHDSRLHGKIRLVLAVDWTGLQKCTNSKT